jgi:hypothetical protein
MATYKVKVVVELNYEVEVDTESDAELQGLNWESYRNFSEIDSIQVEEVESDEDDYNDETDDEYALESAGHGNDEDY